MFDISKLKPRVAGVSTVVLLLTLSLCANLAWAQEAPRPEGSSPLKPTMIKPPMTQSQDPQSGSVKASQRRRKTTRRRRPVRSKPRVVRQNVDALPSSEMPSDAAPGGTNMGSIKPPMENDSDSAFKPSRTDSPVSGGVLNGKAISLPHPAYPPIARSARASGTVTVQVIIDEQGQVVSARAISGHPLLQSAAADAARRATFAPTRLEGQPVKVTGVITYKFVL